MAERVGFHTVTPERWDDLARLFGPRGACAGCWCMWPRLRGGEFARLKGDGTRRRMRALVTAGAEPGILAYAGAEPVGWCAVAPRIEYTRLAGSRVMAPIDDQPVWSVPCFFVAPPFRRRGLTVRMLREAARYARAQGARVLEGYPVDPPGGRTADAFAWWGLAGAFEAAGFCEVARRSKTHPIMRKALRASASRGRRAS